MLTTPRTRPIATALLTTAVLATSAACTTRPADATTSRQPTTFNGTQIAGPDANTISNLETWLSSGGYIAVQHASGQAPTSRTVYSQTLADDVADTYLDGRIQTRTVTDTLGDNGTTYTYQPAKRCYAAAHHSAHVKWPPSLYTFLFSSATSAVPLTFTTQGDTISWVQRSGHKTLRYGRFLTKQYRQGANQVVQLTGYFTAIRTAQGWVKYNGTVRNFPNGAPSSLNGAPGPQC